MSVSNNPNLRIDWFDGTIVENPQSLSSPKFDDEDIEIKSTESQNTIKKSMGFMKLNELSQLESSSILLRLKNPHIMQMFLNLLDTELESNLIVLAVRVLSKLSSDAFSTKWKILDEVLSTNFFDTLKSYINNLPDIRLSEKRHNMLLWNDVNMFFIDLLVLIKNFLEENGGRHDVMILLFESVLESSAGVAEVHMEVFSEKFYTLCDELSDIVKKATTDFQLTADYQKLNIFPTKEDLYHDNLVNIRPNIVDVAYANSVEYLDTQFKLLREDYFAPLRDGIKSYQSNPGKNLHENIRVHNMVKFVCKHATNSKIGFLIEFPKRLLRPDSNQFMYGSLLLFTNDDFKTLLLGTVLDSNQELLSDNYIVVEMYSIIPEDIYKKRFTMIESEVFFEPYHQVLKVLQRMKPNEIPFMDYIVKAMPLTNPPKYLQDKSEYNLNNLPATILDLNSWPLPKELNLDTSQYEAFQHALTREFAVIQGPPGTGKTFIGSLIAKTILENLSLSGTPMLVICCTNHALDQFLEHIVNVTSDVIRIGGQSKSKKLEEYTLNSCRRRTKVHGRAYYDKRKEQDSIMTQMSALQEDLRKCERDVLCYECVKQYLKIGSKSYKLDMYKDYGEPILAWLFEHLGKVKNQYKRNPRDFEGKRVVVSFSKADAVKEIESLEKNLKYVLDVFDNNDGDKDRMEKKFLSEIKMIKEKILFYDEYFPVLMEESKVSKLKPVQSLDKMETNERWKLYFAAVSKVKDNLLKELQRLENALKSCNDEVDELRMMVDTEIVRRARVVGVTTTAAARVHKLLQALKSPIVIVEEAAEVLEAHIIASLTKHCQHLILIGDHKQLRPTAASYKLAKYYNLDISLFERMIKNGVHSKTLTVQHRMRTDICELLVPAIYEQLNSHSNVERYGDVRGVTRNVFFLDHSVNEDSDSQKSWSHKNFHEAEIAVTLAKHLILQGYHQNDIILLTTYTGQMNLIKELARQHEDLRHVKVTVVDNFQGEEGRIVIISLVRSNPEKKIGFLANANRVCVALSRAKEGLFMIGNMTNFAESSDLWRAINEKLKRRNFIGTALEVYNVDDPEIIVPVTKAEDFDPLMRNVSKTSF